MRTLILLLLLAMAVSLAEAQAKKKKQSGLDKVFRSMFTPRTPKIVKSTKRKRSPKPRVDAPTIPPSKTKTFVVDVVWIAKYLEMVQQWDYPIPEDDQIKWENGKYVVPLVVFKHYEDMRKTPPRATPPPVNGALMP